MAKNKQIMDEETSTTIIIDDKQFLTSETEDQVFKDLRNKLAEIRKVKGVIGYIMRSATSAIIDVKEPDRIVDYALFSHRAMDSCREIADLFELSKIKSLLLEGKEQKVLCITVDENNISIFLEKEADQAKILKNFR